MLPLLCFVVLCPAIATAGEYAWPDLSSPPAGTVYGTTDAALLIAIEDYAYVPDILGAKRNLADWLRYLTRTRGIPASNVLKLQHQDVTDSGIREAAERAAKAVGKGGTLWMLYVGHGAPSRSGDGASIGAVDDSLHGAP